MSATVFIGGSRAISRLNAKIRAKLDTLIEKRCRLLIGDANGADKAVQSFLCEKGYSSVLVFCMSGCRNNLGHWPTRVITADASSKGFEFYATKDRMMANEADCGLMLWDGKSRGSFYNILTLVLTQKRVLVYVSPEKSFEKVQSVTDFANLLAKCDRRYVAQLLNRPDVPRELKDCMSNADLHTTFWPDDRKLG